MAASVFRKFGFKKEPRDSEARLKLQKELFAFRKCTEHGFPHKPSCLAYDPKLKLLAIGTKTGALRVYGAPGVEFAGEHPTEDGVDQLIFLPGQGRLISQCSNNSLHLWEINIKEESAAIEKRRSFSMEASKLKTITACSLSNNATQVLLGTEGGNIHLLDISTFQLSEHIIYQDVVMQNVPDDFKINPGLVEAIAEHPTDPNKFLIGYNRGLIVLWDKKDSNAEQTYNASQQLESLTWHCDGTQFMSAHADGSYIIWSSTDSTKPKEQATTPYGPFPCKAISKIQWKSAKADPYIMFSGGMPRASYGDRNTVSVMQGALHTVFDFTSRVVDFICISTSDELDDQNKIDYDDPHSIIVLAEEELVAIDLQSEGWKSYKQPYLWSLHSSAITCAAHNANVPEALWNKICDAGENQMSSFTGREWPIQGGKNLKQVVGNRDLLLTGHEDGSVRFWDASNVSLSLMYKMNTSSIFGDLAAADHSSAEPDEEWPPFRKVGTFDPYSDDPRLAIQKISLCPLSETLVLGGTSGQIVVLQFEREERDQEVKATTCNIVKDHDSFIWKGHEALPVRSGDVKFAAGFQPVAVMQLYPPAACTSLAVQSEWQLVAAGTAHGFGVFDYVQKKEVNSKCTLNPHDLTGTAESPMSRHKSFKKSLRESFRRLRKRRSERRRRAEAEKAEKEQKKEEPKTEEQKTEEGAQATEGAAAAAPAASTTEETPKRETQATSASATAVETSRPVERAIEARSTDDAMSSMVKFLYFADTFLLNAQNHSPTLWAGTNAGTVFAYQITMPANDKRDSEAVQCQIAKEIQLKHRAPVLSICIIDRNAQPLPGPLEVQHERAKAADMTGSHQVLICSEEQFKMFTLPSLKAHHKYKLTAHEGSKVRKIGFINFRSRSDERYAENDLACLTNQGDVHIFSIPQLRRQLKADCVRKENVTGIVSSVFANNGEGFFLASPSEFVHFSMSARFVPIPMCMVEVEEGVRLELVEPPEPEPEPTPEPAAEAAAVEEKKEEGEQEQQQEEQQQEQAAAPAVEKTDESAAAAVVVTGGDGDKAAEAEKPDDSMAEGVNDSLAAGDITVDSVKVHISEDNKQTEVVESMVTRTVVTKTVVSETTNDGTVTQESTTVQQSVVSSGGDDGGASGGAAAAGGGSGPSNLDDDTKIITHHTDETTEEGLEELRITEEGDDTAANKKQREEATKPDDVPDTPPVVGEVVTKVHVKKVTVVSDSTDGGLVSKTVTETTKTEMVDGTTTAQEKQVVESTQSGEQIVEQYKIVENDSEKKPEAIEESVVSAAAESVQCAPPPSVEPESEPVVESGLQTEVTEAEAGAAGEGSEPLFMLLPADSQVGTCRPGDMVAAPPPGSMPEEDGAPVEAAAAQEVEACPTEAGVKPEEPETGVVSETVQAEKVEEVESKPDAEPSEVVPVAAPEVETAPPVEPEVAPEVETAPPVEAEVAPEVETAPPVEAEVAPEVETAPPVEPEVAPEVETAPPVEAEVAPEVETAPQVEAEVAPEVETAPPVEAEAAPEVESAPVEAKAAPEVEIAPPVVAETTPEVETAPPVEAETTPEVETAPPVEAEAAPEVETAPPVEAEAAPEVETAPPVEAEAAPEVETAPPVEAEAAPEVETAPPVEAEAAPEVETAPVEPEAAPEVEKAPPVEPEAVPEAEAAAPVEPEAAPVEVAQETTTTEVVTAPAEEPAGEDAEQTPAASSEVAAPVAPPVEDTTTPAQNEPTPETTDTADKPVEDALAPAAAQSESETQAPVSDSSSKDDSSVPPPASDTPSV